MDGVEYKPHELIIKVRDIAGSHGIGRIEHMEDRAIGLKSRETYEVPSALILIKAHKDLEKYVCTKSENSFKTIVDQRWTELAYEGLWVDPLKDALDAFINEINKKVTGSAKVKLFKGSAEVIARESPNGLYDLNLATYETDSTINQRLSYGFIPLFGMQSKMGFLIKKKLKEEKK